VSIDFDDAGKRSTEEHTFSNSTMFEIWSSHWCARCRREAPLRAGLPNAQGCALVGVAELGRKPAEWLRQQDEDLTRDGGYDVANLFHCIEFRPPGGGAGEPRPKPEPPNIAGLFDRPERRARMFVQPHAAPELVEVR
jgi:hypothetical protein